MDCALNQLVISRYLVVLTLVIRLSIFHICEPHPMDCMNHNSRLGNSNGSSESRFELGDLRARNHMQLARYKEVMCRYAAMADKFERDVMFR